MKEPDGEYPSVSMFIGGYRAERDEAPAFTRARVVIEPLGLDRAAAP